MKITQSRLNKLSDISISIGQVFFASAFVEPLIGGDFHLYSIVVGLILSGITWFLAIFFTKI